MLTAGLERETEWMHQGTKGPGEPKAWADQSACCSRARGHEPAAHPKNLSVTEWRKNDDCINDKPSWPAKEEYCAADE